MALFYHLTHVIFQFGAVHFFWQMKYKMLGMVSSSPSKPQAFCSERHFETMDPSGWFEYQTTSPTVARLPAQYQWPSLPRSVPPTHQSSSTPLSWRNISSLLTKLSCNFNRISRCFLPGGTCSAVEVDATQATGCGVDPLVRAEAWEAFCLLWDLLSLIRVGSSSGTPRAEKEGYQDWE